MEESFDLITVGNQLIQTKLVIRGYRHWFEAQVGAITVIYEKDEEGMYRAVSQDQFAPADITLVQAVAARLQHTFG